MGESWESTDLSAEAFVAHYQHVYRFLLRRTGNRHRAEELTQQVFADAAVALRRFRPGATPVLALLYTLAQRRFADAARGRARVEPMEALEGVVDSVPAVEHDDLLAQAVRTALASLPPDLRVVATMKLVQGCSFAEIAHCVGATEVACRKRFQRALEHLRGLLESDGYGHA